MNIITKYNGLEINNSVSYRKIDAYKYITNNDRLYITSFFPPQDIQTEFIWFRRLRPESGYGLLWIKKGYCWDGCSGPTIDFKTNMRAGLVHDALYQLMRLGLLPIKYRPNTDSELRLVCIEDGMIAFRAWYFWKAVRLFGYGSAKLEKEYDENMKTYIAP